MKQITKCERLTMRLSVSTHRFVERGPFTSACHFSILKHVARTHAWVSLNVASNTVICLAQRLLPPELEKNPDAAIRAVSCLAGEELLLFAIRPFDYTLSYTSWAPNVHARGLR